jgi:hypothetical protein
MNVHRAAILGVLLLAAACSQTPVNSATVARVDGPHPAFVRATAGSVWVGASTVSEPHSAWTLPARGDVADLDVMPIGSSGGFAVTFRQGGAQWQGYLDPHLRAMGDLEQVDTRPATATLVAASTMQQ